MYYSGAEMTMTRSLDGYSKFCDTALGSRVYCRLGFLLRRFLFGPLHGFSS